MTGHVNKPNIERKQEHSKMVHVPKGKSVLCFKIADVSDSETWWTSQGNNVWIAVIYDIFFNRF
jgi:hypothetical protein